MDVETHSSISITIKQSSRLIQSAFQEYSFDFYLNLFIHQVNKIPELFCHFLSL